MPTVFRRGGFAVMIYTQDHIPAHVHVWRAGGEIVMNIATLEIARIAVSERRAVATRSKRNLSDDPIATAPGSDTTAARLTLRQTCSIHG